MKHLQHHLSERIRQMALQLAALRWVDAARIHITLAFLGELTDEQLSLAMAATEATASALYPFDYRLVIWASLGHYDNHEPSGLVSMRKQPTCNISMRFSIRHWKNAVSPWIVAHLHRILRFHVPKQPSSQKSSYFAATSGSKRLICFSTVHCERST